MFWKVQQGSKPANKFMYLPLIINCEARMVNLNSFAGHIKEAGTVGMLSTFLPCCGQRVCYTGQTEARNKKGDAGRA